MKKIIPFIVIPFLFCSCIFPGIHIDTDKMAIRCTGPVETRLLPVEGDFWALEINGGFDINLVNVSDSTSVEVTANNEVFDYIEAFTKEEGGQKILVLQYKDHANVRAKECRITIVSTCFSSITVNGAADLDYPSPAFSGYPLDVEINGAGDIEISEYSGPKMSVTVNGAADIDLKDISALRLDVMINGAGDVNVSGEVNVATFDVNGVGDVNARNLTVKEATKVSRAGLATVRLKK